MRYLRRTALSAFLFSFSLVSPRVFSADATTNPANEFAPDFRTRVRDQAFQKELCVGSPGGKAGVARIMVTGTEQFRASRGNEAPAVDTFKIANVSDSQSALAAIMAAEGIVALSRAGRLGKPLSLGAAEVVCLAVLMNYESFLKRNPNVAATELDLIGIAGTAFEAVFFPTARAQN
jgi:hypothetical protein